MPLKIKPCHLRAAREYVGQYHRHSIPPVGGKFAVACYAGDDLCGVAICGRPVSRHLDDGQTLEILRCCTDGTRNACSKLYGACCRIGFDMDDAKRELLKEIFWAMNEVGYSTSTATHDVVTETDDGHGNIVETTTSVTETTLYITVSHKTADEIADVYNFTTDQRAQLAELLAEENRSMWSAVLYGIGAGDGEIVTVALSQIGNVGGQPYWSWYGFNSRVDWCAIFVSWCANECGYIDAGVIPKFAGCITGSQWFKDRGLWQDRNYEPRPGDLIFFDWDDPGGFSGPQDGLCDHVGIVEKVENGVVYTVEGNSGDKCREAHYPVGHYEIYGYGRPAY